MKQFLRYFWNTIAHPRANFDALSAERSVRWALVVSVLPVLQVWGNVACMPHSAWIGSARSLFWLTRHS